MTGGQMTMNRQDRQMMGGQMMGQSEADTYVRRFVFYNLDEREMKRYRALGYSDDTIKGAANIALRSGQSMDYVLRRITTTGLPLSQVAVLLGVPANVVNADIAGMGLSRSAMGANMGMAGTPSSTAGARNNGSMNNGAGSPMAAAPAPITEASLGADLAQPVTNTAGPQTPPPDELRTLTPAEQAQADQGAQDTLRRSDPQMRSVIEQFRALGAPPLFTLSPEQARQQPSIATAVKALIEKRGGTPRPEPVASVRDTTVPGPAGPVPVRVYMPQGAGPFPALVYFHGGGFVIATIDTYDSSCRALANAAGCVVVSVEYRKAPEAKLPAPHEDGYAATQYVMNNPAEFNVDPSRVAVGGESAGGNLAADVCLLARARGGKMPVHQMLVYPIAGSDTNTPSYRENANAVPLNRPAMEWFFNYILPNERFAQSALVNLVEAPWDRNFPPATVITAEIDPLRSEGQALARRLRQAGVSVRERNYQGVTHEFFGTGAVVDKAKQAVQFAADGLKASFNR